MAKVGYGASGSYDRSDSTPAQAMAREIQEELGLPPLPRKHSPSSAWGWTQSGTSSSSPISGRRTTPSPKSAGAAATGLPPPGEQTIFFVPLEPSVCEAFLRQAAFEPGAAYSLMRLLQKRRDDSPPPPTASCHPTAPFPGFPGKGAVALWAMREL